MVRRTAFDVVKRAVARNQEMADQAVKTYSDLLESNEAARCVTTKRPLTQPSDTAEEG